MTIRSRLASVVAFAVLAAAGVAHAEEPEFKYFVEVSVPSVERSVFYFVIVGQNGPKEGSYGTGTAGERPEAIGVGACDKPQDLTGTCP